MHCIYEKISLSMFQNRNWAAIFWENILCKTRLIFIFVKKMFIKLSTLKVEFDFKKIGTVPLQIPISCFIMFCETNIQGAINLKYLSKYTPSTISKIISINYFLFVFSPTIMESDKMPKLKLKIWLKLLRIISNSNSLK